MKKVVLYGMAGLAALVVITLVGAGTTYLVISQMGPSTALAATNVDLAKGSAVTLKEFVTNLSDIERPRYIKVTFELVARDERDAKRLEENAPLVRDIILSLLNSKRSTEVSGETGAATLKAEIMERINTRLGGPFVQKVLITDFVVQF